MTAAQYQATLLQASALERRSRDVQSIIDGVGALGDAFDMLLEVIGDAVEAYREFFALQEEYLGDCLATPELFNEEIQQVLDDTASRYFVLFFTIATRLIPDRVVRTGEPDSTCKAAIEIHRDLLSAQMMDVALLPSSLQALGEAALDEHDASQANEK